MKQNGKDFRKVPNQSQREAARQRAVRRKIVEDQRSSWPYSEDFFGGYYGN